MAFCVYKHTAPNGKIYIGITSQRPEDRWGHGANYRDNEYFFRAIKKYGWEQFKHEVLFDGLTKEEAEAKEIELIALYDSTNYRKGYNSRKGGSVCSFSEQTIQKMRESHLGKKIPPEQRAKLSAALKGRKTSKGNLGHKQSEAAKKRISDANKGRKKSADEKNRISKGRKGIMIGAENHKSTAVINLTTGIVYESQRQASIACKVGQSNICMCCNGMRRTAGGYRWQYYKQ